MLKIYAMGLEFFRKKLEVRLLYYSVAALDIGLLYSM